MTFLKKFNWSSVSMTLMVGAVTIQWSTIVHALYFDKQTIHISFTELYEAEFTAGAVLISFGAVLGTINHLQLLVMAILEVAFFKTNAWILFNVLPDALGHTFYDIGGSMVIHAFGAYFGLACTRMIFKENMRENKKEGASYNTDLFAMIGTIFLWMYWPSFNSIPAANDFEKQITIINTYFALTAAVIAAFATSGFGDHHHQHKFNMVHIQNSTLAGAVAIGSSANFQMDVFGAIIIGAIAGAVSVLGYQLLTPALLKNFNIHDTCGVHNLHGIPGVLGAIFSIAFGAWSTIQPDNFSALGQLYSILITLGIALVGGFITGFILDAVPCLRSDDMEMFEDAEFWEQESGEESAAKQD